MEKVNKFHNLICTKRFGGVDEKTTIMPMSTGTMYRRDAIDFINDLIVDGSMPGSVHVIGEWLDDIQKATYNFIGAGFGIPSWKFSLLQIPQSDTWQAVLHMIDKDDNALARVLMNHEYVSVNNVHDLMQSLPSPVFLTKEEIIDAANIPDVLPNKAISLNQLLSANETKALLSMSQSPGISSRLFRPELDNGSHRFWMLRTGLRGHVRKIRDVCAWKNISSNVIFVEESLLDIWSSSGQYLCTAIVEKNKHDSGDWRVLSINCGVHARLTTVVLETCFNERPDSAAMKEKQFMFTQPTANKESNEMSQDNNEPQPTAAPSLATNVRLWNETHSKNNVPLVLVDGFAPMFANTFMQQLETVDEVTESAKKIESLFRTCISAAVRHGGWSENVVSQNEYFYTMFANLGGVAICITHASNPAAMFSIFFPIGQNHYSLTIPDDVPLELLSTPAFPSGLALNEQNNCIHPINKAMSLAEFEYMFSNAAVEFGKPTTMDVVTLLGYRNRQVPEVAATMEGFPTWESISPGVTTEVTGGAIMESPDKNVIVTSDWLRFDFSSDQDPKAISTGFVRGSYREMAHTVAKAVGGNAANLVETIYNSILADIVKIIPDFDPLAEHEAAVAAEMARMEVNDAKPVVEITKENIVVELSPELVERATPESGMDFAQQFLNTLADAGIPVEVKPEPQLHPVKLSSEPAKPSMYQHPPLTDEQGDFIASANAAIRADSDAVLRDLSLTMKTTNLDTFLDVVGAVVERHVTDPYMHQFSAFIGYAGHLASAKQPGKEMTFAVEVTTPYRNTCEEDTKVMKLIMEIRLDTILIGAFHEERTVSLK